MTDHRFNILRWYKIFAGIISFETIVLAISMLAEYSTDILHRLRMHIIKISSFIISL